VSENLFFKKIDNSFNFVQEAKEINRAMSVVPALDAGTGKAAGGSDRRSSLRPLSTGDTSELDVCQALTRPMMGKTLIEKDENVLLGNSHSGSVFGIGKADETPLRHALLGARYGSTYRKLSSKKMFYFLGGRPRFIGDSTYD